MSRKQYRQELEKTEYRSPTHELWMMVIQRTKDDLELWSQQKRLRKYSQGGSAVTGACTIDTYLSAIHWITDSPDDESMLFSEVCEHLSLDPEAVFESLIGCLDQPTQKQLVERRKRNRQC